MSPDTITLRPPCATYTRGRLPSTSCLRDWQTCSGRRSASRGKESVQNPVQLEIPSQDELAKLLITGNLQSAEVVELADTPSKSPKSRLFSKFRVFNQEATKSDTGPPYLINCS